MHHHAGVAAVLCGWHRQATRLPSTGGRGVHLIDVICLVSFQCLALLHPVRVLRSCIAPGGAPQLQAATGQPPLLSGTGTMTADCCHQKAATGQPHLLSETRALAATCPYQLQPARGTPDCWLALIHWLKVPASAAGSLRHICQWCQGSCKSRLTAAQLTADTGAAWHTQGQPATGCT